MTTIKLVNLRLCLDYLGELDFIDEVLNAGALQHFYSQLTNDNIRIVTIVLLDGSVFAFHKRNFFSVLVTRHDEDSELQGEGTNPSEVGSSEDTSVPPTTH